MPSVRPRDILDITATLLVALWWGGLTFYSACVIPIGTGILSSTAQGFVTQQVTLCLNALCLVALIASGPRTFRSGPRREKLSWLLVTGLLLALAALHQHLGTMLDSRTMSLTVNSGRFYSSHRWYLLLTSGQWLSGLSLLLLRIQPRPRPDTDTQRAN